jgi:hypothetical protein
MSRFQTCRRLGRAAGPFGALLVAVNLVHAGVPAPAGGGDLEPSADSAAITRRQTSIDRSGDFRNELQACRSGASQQGLATCLEEARNAAAARKHGELELRGENYLANALRRCEPFAGEDRAACEARVMGFGRSSGSVADGGVLRWVETVVLPRGQHEMTFVPKTSETVVVVPVRK